VALRLISSVSIGVRTPPEVAMSADDLIKAAHAAMYKVKGAGKRRLSRDRRSTRVGSGFSRTKEPL
jgi:hypothetical protein